MKKSKFLPVAGELSGEFMGTFYLGLVTFFSILVLKSTEPLVVAITVLTAFVIFGKFSKGHFNPVLSIAEYVSDLLKQIYEKKFDKKALGMLGLYLLVQLVAMFAAFGMVQLFAGSVEGIRQAQETAMYGEASSAGAVYTTSYNDGYDIFAFSMEFVMTFVFTLVYLVSKGKDKAVSVATATAAGLSLFALTLIASSYTGASFNPFRSLVPAVFAWADSSRYLWVYLAGPFVGAVWGGIIFRIFDSLTGFNKKA
jgi:aquaporin Z